MKAFSLPLGAAALLLAASLPSAGQGRFGFRHAPHDDCEAAGRGHRPHRPVLNRLVQDLRIARAEVHQALHQTRTEVDRAVYATRNEIDRAVYATRHEVDRVIHHSFHDPCEFETFETFESHEERYGYRERSEPYRGHDRRRERERQPAPPPAGGDLRTDPAPPIEIVRPDDDSPDPRPSDPQPRTEAPAEPRDPVLEEPEEDERDERGFTRGDRRNIPLATRTDRPGYVRSPYPPFELLDVSEFEPGDLAMEPDSDRVFRIPE